MKLLKIIFLITILAFCVGYVPEKTALSQETFIRQAGIVLLPLLGLLVGYLANDFEKAIEE